MSAKKTASKKSITKDLKPKKSAKGGASDYLLEIEGVKGESKSRAPRRITS